MLHSTSRQPGTRDKLASIQALRGMAVLAVVAFHMMAMERKYLGGAPLLPDFVRLGETGVDLFFVISGFVMVTVTQGRFGRMAEVLQFLWGRATRIYPTYWFYALLSLGVFLVKPAWVNSSQGNQVSLLASFLLLPSELLPIVLVAWSLVHELWFYLVFAGLLFFRERQLLPLLLLWAAAVAAANLALDVPKLSPALRLVVHPFTFEFLAGAAAALLVRTAAARRLPAGTLWAALGLAVGVGLPAAYLAGSLQLSTMVRACVFAALYATVLVSLVLLEQREAVKLPRALVFVGDISYTVYLSHVLVLSVIGRIWAMLVPGGFGLLALPLMLAAVTVYGWVGYRLVEQPVGRAAHRLRARWFSGGRRAPAPPGQALP